MTEAIRSVPEWVADHPDQAIPKAVRLRIFARYAGRCYLSGRVIRPGDRWEAEHIIALSNGGQHREGNLAPALADAHKEKTKADAGTRAKINRVRAKHIGAWPKSKRPLRSRGFSPSRQGGGA
jgi:5-methylcytosine-specific restriction protein A